MTRPVALLLAAALAIGVAITAGCGRGADPPAAPPTLNTGRADFNPMDPAKLRDGGELRWPIEGVPETFNYHQVNGASDDNASVVNALMPRAFVSTPDGRRRPDPNYVVSAELTSRSPQTVRYVINPRASWSDGTPITWQDFAAQWKALNGADPSYQSVGSNGYDDITGVARGADDKQAVVTIGRNFAEWPALFSPLYPASTNSSSTAFNTGWAQKVPVSAGPFKLQAVDPVAKTITVARDDAWWGPKAKLDRIVYKTYDPGRYADGLAANDIDFYPIGDSVGLVRRARTTPNVVLRQSVDRGYKELVVNGGPGTALADVRLRQAIARGIDRTAIARRVLGEIVPAIRTDGNHVYPMGSAEYRDNSDQLAFDAARAGRELDALGWIQQGGRRLAGGKPLQLRVVTTVGDQTSEQIGAALAEQLDDLGVTVLRQPMPPDAKVLALRQGNFDLIDSEAGYPHAPLSNEVRRYYEAVGPDVGQNYGRIYNDQITDLFGDGIRELDDIERAADGNRVDDLIWTVVHSLPLYPSPGAYAVKASLANFGAPGLSDVDYTQVGFVP